MATLSYVRFVTSSKDKKFRVILGSLERLTMKNQSRVRTISGKASTTEGSHIVTHHFTIKVYAVDPGTGYGTLADLRYYFGLKNPADTSNNPRFTYYDHLNTAHTVEMIGQMSEKLQTPMLDSTGTYFTVDVSLEEVDAA